MRPDISVGAMCVLLAMTWTLSSTASFAIQEPVRAKSGTPSASLVKPGQEMVVVEKDQTSPLFVEPPKGMRPIAWLTSLVPIVLVVHVERVEPHLTPAGDWSRSKVYGQVEQVLKTSNGTISPGQVTTVFSIPVSPSVVATVATRDEELVLLVLWRGSARWYATGSHRGGNSGFAQDGTLRVSLQYRRRQRRPALRSRRAHGHNSGS